LKEFEKMVIKEKKLFNIILTGMWFFFVHSKYYYVLSSMVQNIKITFAISVRVKYSFCCSSINYCCIQHSKKSFKMIEEINDKIGMSPKARVAFTISSDLLFLEWCANIDA
jgi:hypothetical protein